MKNPYLSLVRTIWHYGSSWRPAIVVYYFAYVVAQGALSLSPYAFGKTVEVLQNFNSGRLKEVIVWLSVGVGVLFVFWLFHGPARVVERNIALKIQQNFRLGVYQQLTRLPLAWHQAHHSGNIITRLNRAAVAMRQFAETQFIYIETIVKFIISISFLLWLSVPVGILSVLMSIAVTSIVILFDRKLIPLYDAQNEIDNHIGAVLFDYINNMTTVLTLRLGELTHSNLAQRMQAVWPFFRKDAVLNETKWFTMMILLSAVQALLLIGYIIHTLQATGTIMIGVVVMIFRYQWDLNTVFYDLSVHYSLLVHMDTDIQGMQPILHDVKKWARLPQGAATARQWHSLKISDLTFSHREGDFEKALHQIDFLIKRGEKIALIGPSGGGKSTLLNLLGGLYKPSYVNLTIDGAEFNSLEPLQVITTLVPQDPEIFENTIAFNITLDLPATIEEINTIANIADFLAVLNNLPLGLETNIQEKGLNLSVGQKQRLALARGLFAARFSSLILMDEPTSSVDLMTEKKILNNVINAFPQAAIIMSLHRLHLLPKFDSVIMVSHGKIIVQGATADLLSREGPVYNLWKTYQQDFS